jgi:hypothetical protein
VQGDLSRGPDLREQADTGSEGNKGYGERLAQQLKEDPGSSEETSSEETSSEDSTSGESLGQGDPSGQEDRSGGEEEEGNGPR